MAQKRVPGFKWSSCGCLDPAEFETREPCAAFVVDPLVYTACIERKIDRSIDRSIDR